MSYILEALKKAEQKREREERPKPLAISRETGGERRGWPLWSYFLLALLIINTGVMVWWIGPWRNVTQAPSGLRTAAGLQASSLPPAAPTPAPVEKSVQGSADTKETLKPKVTDKPLPQPVTQAVPAGVAPVDRTPAKASGDRPTVIVPTGDRATSQTPAPQRQARADKETAAPGRVMRLAELPPAITGVLPEFRVSGHAYSPEPESRIVRINDKILQQGQELSPGLKVDEITPEGIILSFQGYRFRIGTKENQ
jgi:general secretion pathway protein B